MGSTGSGNFTDYTGQRQRTNSSGAGAGAGGATTLCDQVVDAELEDVERCAYFKTNGLPAVGTPVVIARGARVTVSVGGLELGYLPTAYNYLVSCLEQGYTHSGTVTSALNRPIVRVRVNIIPVAPP